MKRDEVREREIIRRRTGGETLASIGRSYGVSESRVHAILAAARERGAGHGMAHISARAIHRIWDSLGPDPVDLWIVPQGAGMALRIVSAEAWVQGAVMVGTYTGHAVLDRLADDVRTAEAEFWRIRTVS